MVGVLSKNRSLMEDFFVKKPFEKLTNKNLSDIIYRNGQVQYVFCRFYAKDEYE